MYLYVSRFMQLLSVGTKSLPAGAYQRINLGRASEYSSKAESFLNGSNANFLEAQYLDWVKCKATVDSSWDGFYDSLSGSALKIEEFQDVVVPELKDSRSEGETVTKTTIDCYDLNKN